MSHNTFGSFSKIRIPPESSGPGIQNVIIHGIDYSGGTAEFKTGEEVTGGTSGAIGVVIHSIEDTPGVGGMQVSLEENSPGAEFEVGETLTLASGSATVTTITKSYVNSTVNVGGNNPYFIQSVDRAGAAHVRFEEGSQQLDAFGLSRFSSPQLMATFNFHYTEADPFMSNEVILGGAITHLPVEAAVAISTGTASGDYAMKTSDQYYPYFPGIGRSVEMTVQHSDLGKTNNIRRWGYFDDSNGVFFQIDENGISVVLRSKSSGSVVDTVVPQDEWINDRVNGDETKRNNSTMDLDVTKLNIYWLDLQWLGAGRVRMGVSGEDGSRILVHSFENANAHPNAYMATGSLPVRFVNENTGVTSGTSTLKVVCASVKNDGEDITSSVFNTNKQVSYIAPEVTGISTEQYILGIRSAPTFAGIANRIISILQSTNVNVKGNALVLRIYRKVTLTGVPSWATANPYSPLQVDMAASGWTGGVLVGTVMVGIGTQFLTDLAALRSYTKYDGTEIAYAITAEQIDASATSDVRLGITWIDRN